MLIDALLMTVTELSPRVDANLPIVLSDDWISVKEGSRPDRLLEEVNYQLFGLVLSTPPDRSKEASPSTAARWAASKSVAR